MLQTPTLPTYCFFKELSNRLCCSQRAALKRCCCFSNTLFPVSSHGANHRTHRGRQTPSVVLLKSLEHVQPDALLLSGLYGRTWSEEFLVTWRLWSPTWQQAASRPLRSHSYSPSHRSRPPLPCWSLLLGVEKIKNRRDYVDVLQVPTVFIWIFASAEAVEGNTPSS